MIEHEMLLLDADFKVVARMVGKMKKHARVAESRGADPVSQNTQVEILSLAPNSERE